MNLLEILQLESLEKYYVETDFRTCGYSLQDIDLVEDNCNKLWSEFYATLTPDQKNLYAKYNEIKDVHNVLVSKVTYQKGFRLAIKIMTESHS